MEVHFRPKPVNAIALTVAVSLGFSFFGGLRTGKAEARRIEAEKIVKVCHVSLLRFPESENQANQGTKNNPIKIWAQTSGMAKEIRTVAVKRMLGPNQKYTLTPIREQELSEVDALYIFHWGSEQKISSPIYLELSYLERSRPEE